MYLLLLSIFLFCEGALSAEADITVLNKNNIDAFMANQYTFCYFCDFQTKKNKDTCEKGEEMFREAAVIITEQNKLIKFCIMDISKETELAKNLQVYGGQTFVFYLRGKSSGFTTGSDTNYIVNYVYKKKDNADKQPELFIYDYKQKHQ